MATKVVHVSDVSGLEPSAGEELVTVRVLEHPAASEPATLEMLPAELAALDLDESVQLVRLEIQEPGSRRPRSVALPVAAFNALAPDGDMGSVLTSAIAAARQERSRAAAGSTPKGRRGAARGRVNYASLEHAGEPHRGRIMEEEKQIVRDNLDQVNERLRDAGLRVIDPADPEMRRRYGLSSPASA